MGDVKKGEDFIDGLWNFTKKLAKIGSTSAAIGLGYTTGAAGTLIVDILHYTSKGIFTIDPANFSRYLTDNTLATLRHANEVGGMFATAAAIGSTFILYKINRR
jgi:hypothetical protein